MIKFKFLIFFVCLSSIACSQSKQDYNWLLGFEEPGVLGYRIDFNNSSFEIISQSNGFPFDNQNASISDENGNLLFYSNGCAVINRESELMENGDSLNYDQFLELANWGDCKEQGYPGVQDILILKDPNQVEGYYVIHKAVIFKGFDVDLDLEMRYSYVDLSLNNGLGAVTQKNIILNDESILFSYLTAISHENGKDWWVVQPLMNDSIFTTFLIGEMGIERMPNQNTNQYFSFERSAAAGTAKFSPDGTKYAIYNYTDQLHLYDFDRSTGQMSNHQKINVFESSEIDSMDIRFGSLEWSSNSRFIYTASALELHQVEISEEGELIDVILIDEYNGTQDPFSTSFFLLNQAPDCKIYMCSTNSSNSYHVIKSPNEKGLACDFVQNGIELPSTSSVASFPNFPRYRVDEEEKCDQTITSLFEPKELLSKSIASYPNPSSGIVNFLLPEVLDDYKLKLINSQGKVINVFNIPNETDFQIDLNSLQNGIYYGKLSSNNSENVSYIVKIVLLR